MTEIEKGGNCAKRQKSRNSGINAKLKGGNEEKGGIDENAGKCN